MADEPFDRMHVEMLARQPVGGRAFEEMARQFSDVRSALAQRRQDDRHDRKPVIKILAERACFDQLRQILVGRRDDTNVGADHAAAADRGELA